MWYELTKATQHQLLECMADWGHFLEYDEDQDMFFAPEKRNEQAVPGEAAGADWYETLVRAPTRSKESTKEVLAVAKTIFTIRTLYRTHGGGTTPASPAFCDHARNSHSGSSEECEWTAPFCREFNKRPIIDTDGPIFVEHARYHCSRHNSYASDEPTKPGDNNIPHHKLKDMRYTTEFILTVQSIYVDTLSVAATRRRILDQWTAKALGKIGNLKEAQLKYAFGTMELQRASYLLLALEDFVPSDQSISRLLLMMFQQTVAPHLNEYDRMVCAFDGQLIRLDGTMKCAARVLVKEPEAQLSKRKRKAKAAPPRLTYKKVAGAVLVVVGLEGMCLTTPRLVPAESNPHIAILNKDILRMRRSVLGSLSAPAGYVTDCIRRHKKVLLKSLLTIYPEMKNALENPEQKDCILWGQDVPHREWVFTRTIAGRRRTHGDYVDYVAAVKEVFHQLRVPHNTFYASDESMKTAWERWQTTMKEDMVEGEQKETEWKLLRRASLRNSVLRHDRSTPEDDEFTKKALRNLGLAAMHHIPPLDPEYIPRRVLRRACHRMLIPASEIDLLLPDFGYTDGDDFALHLSGVHIFYKQRRSLARKYKPSTVITSLGSPNKKRRRTSNLVAAQPDTDSILEPVEEAVIEALLAIHDETVTPKHNPTQQTSIQNTQNV